MTEWEKCAERLFACARSVVFGTEETFPPLTPEETERLYRFSKMHDLAHLAGAALEAHGCLAQDKTGETFRTAMLSAVVRCERISYALTQVCQALEAAEVPHIPLKGSVLRLLYPEGWMRTSCDIDILVHKEDLAKAGTALVQAGAVKDDTPQSGHDISYHTQNGVHLELHFTLIEESVLQKADVPLSRVWEYAVPAAEGTYRCVLTEEMFLYYHLAHMAKHFCNGGCGIRPFLDLALLEKKWSPDRKKLSALLDEGGLTDFARTATTLSRAWFLGAPMEKKAEQVASYLLRGGVYGTTENRVTVSQARRGGKVSYAFFRLFPPFRVMVVAHPVLHKCPVLLPAFWVGRFFRILFDGRGKKAVQELRYIGGIQKTEQEQTDDMLRFLGLL